MKHVIGCLLIAATISGYAELKNETDLSYGTSESQKLDVWWETSNQNAPIIFLVHGGGWKGGDKKAYSHPFLAELVTKKGCILVSPNYRLLESSEDPSPFEVIQDVWLALAWVMDNAERFQADKSRILVGGSSAGSHLSACLAYGNNRNWLTETPYADSEEKILSSIKGWYGDSCVVSFSVPDEQKQSIGHLFMPIKEIDQGEPAAYMSNGNTDKATPLEAVESFQQKCETLGIPCKVFVLPGGHMVGTRIILNDYDQAAPKFKEVMDKSEYEKNRKQATDNLLTFMDDTVLKK